MAKLDRNRNMYFASFDKTAWEVLGKDNDDLSKELNPDTETSKNVLGEATFKHKAAAVQEKYGDADIKGYFVEAVFDGTDAAKTAGKLTGTGYQREAYLVPQSTGGDTAGFAIPFTVNPVGPMTEVTVVYTLATREVTITAKTGG